ncbi:MAG: hypothetical protein H7A35_11700 [Planctomycetales bacterium]|nr:MAG: hypothetical protein H7A35_11700 [Planctomycetales bacterium]
MGRFTFTGRDFAVILGTFAALILAYGVIQVGIFLVEVRKYYAIEAARTPNDLAVDNTNRIWGALLTYEHENPNQLPETLDELVASGNLRSVPLNPFSGKPVKRMRLDEKPVPGDICYITGSAEYGRRDGKEVNPERIFVIVGYGDPDGEYYKYASGRHMTWNESLRGNDVRLPDEWDCYVVYIEGELGGIGPCKLNEEWYYRSQSIEEAMLNEGYELPIKAIVNDSGQSS